MSFRSPAAVLGPEPPELEAYKAARASVRTFLGNDTALRGALADLTAALVCRAETGKPSEAAIARLNREVGRCLFNYLCCASALVDHCRRILALAKTKNASFVKEYVSRVSRFLEPELVFVIELRNLASHRALPLVYSHTKHGRSLQKPEASVLLGTYELRATTWKPAVRKYLDHLRGDLEVLPVVARYTDAVVGFHSWFGPELRQWACASVGGESRQRVPVWDVLMSPSS